MAWCKCTERPKCERSWCDQWADVSAWQIDWTKMQRPYTEQAVQLATRPIFMCRGCYNGFITASKRPWHGIDRPAHADEDWRPSITHHVRMNLMNQRAEQRMREPQIPMSRKPCPLPAKFVARLNELTSRPGQSSSGTENGK